MARSEMGSGHHGKRKNYVPDTAHHFTHEMANRMKYENIMAISNYNRLPLWVSICILVKFHCDVLNKLSEDIS